MSENKTATASEVFIIDIKSDTPTLITGITSYNAADGQIFEVGSAWPTLDPITTDETADTGNWNLGWSYTNDNDGILEVSVAFVRNVGNLGVAKIEPGASVTALMGFSLDGTTINAVGSKDIFWSQEYSGEGNGVLADRAKKAKSESGAFAAYTAGLTLSIASLAAALAF